MYSLNYFILFYDGTTRCESLRDFHFNMEPPMYDNWRPAKEQSRSRQIGEKCSTRLQQQQQQQLIDARRRTMRNTGERPGKVVDASSTDTLIKTHGSGRRCGSVACTYRRRRVSISQTQQSIHCPWNVIPHCCRPPALLHYPVVRLQAIAVSYNGNLCVVSLHYSYSLLISFFFSVKKVICLCLFLWGDWECREEKWKWRSRC